MAIYVPFFLTLEAIELGAVVVTYVAAGVVFLLSLLVARRTVAFGLPERVNRWLVPAILTFVGVYVLVSGWFLG